MKILFPICILLFPLLLPAQHHDNVSLIGYYGGFISPPDDNLGISVLSFPDGSLKVEENFELSMYFSATNAPFSDSSGVLQCYTNGQSIMNTFWDTIPGGETLTTSRPGPAIWPQYALALPRPGHQNRVMLVYGHEATMYPFGPGVELWYVSHRLYAAEIDMAANEGMGAVLYTADTIVDDTLALGKFTACKHANGRDWWILAHEQNSKSFYTILLDPEGLHLIRKQKVSNLNIVDGVGQACFSPNGEHYLMYDGITLDSSVGCYLNMYDFDRCTGLLSKHRQLHIQSGGWGGVAFSPNSRYFYFNNWSRAYQYDMEAPDLAASQQLVAVWDGASAPNHTAFKYMQLMPDGKIYTCTYTITNVLHVIQYPDEPAASCDYQQRAVQLPTKNSTSMPNFPNFRLGPLDGSSCDTLGLDNLPQAWYRYTLDTLDPLSVVFHDLSYYEPETWTWDFGDGSMGSSERHPVHVFDSAGVYKVCLTVSNGNGSHTHCKTLYLGVSASHNPVLLDQVKLAPNPFTDRLSVAQSVNLRSPVFRLYDQTGRLLRQEALTYGITEITTASLPPGIYFWELRSMGDLIKSGKCVKMQK